MNPEETSKIIEQAVHSVKWAALLQFLPRLITPITTVILAAILAPEDFGVVAAATVVLSLANTLIAMGLGATIVQRRGTVDEAASMAFWMSLMLAGLMYAILWLLSPNIATIYKIAHLEPVLKVVGLSLIISAFVTVPNAILQRDLHIKKLFVIGVVPQLINALASVALALFRFGFWSLVIGSLVGLLAGAVLSWLFCRWRPKFSWHPETLRSIFSFSLWIASSGFLSWLFLYADNALAGYFFGAAGLGQYSLGFNIATLLAGMIISPIAMVLYPAFCKVGEQEVIGKDLLRVQSMAGSILFPICFGLSAMAIPLVATLYGNKWPELGFIIQTLSLLPGLVQIWSLNADAYRSIGHPELWTYISLGGAVVLFPLMLWAGTMGLREFVIARAIGSLTVPILSVYVSRKYLRVSLGEQFRSIFPPLFSAVIMYLAVSSVNTYLSPFAGAAGLLKLGLSGMIGLATYILAFVILDERLLRKVFRMAWETVVSRPVTRRLSL